MTIISHIAHKNLFREQAYIGGTWQNAEDGAMIPVHNPADGALLGNVPRLSLSSVEDAISAAAKAFPEWSALTGKERSIIMRRWYELIMLHKDDLSKIMTLEQGKPLAESAGEIAYAASFIEWFSEEAKRVYGELIPAPKADQRILVMKQPVGVVTAITPWNFPAAMITRKVGPALATGCTIVVKPSELTPYSALALASLAEEAGIPSGVLNIVTGDARMIGECFTESPLVAKLSFTGSTAVGKLLMAASAKSVKRTSMELGGNAPFIVFDDADNKAAVEGAMASKFRNMGQTCVCANRILVQDGIYDAFLAAFTKEVEALKLGNGLEEGITQGPLISEEAAQKVERLLKDAVEQGAKILMGGTRATAQKSGLFFLPTIITGVTPAMEIMKEEIFGPVAALCRFATEEEAIHIANDTKAGLAAYAYTRDLSRSWRVSEKLHYGIVGMNQGLISNEMAPFGGMKESGTGREGSHLGIEDYVNVKYVNMGI